MYLPQANHVRVTKLISCQITHLTLILKVGSLLFAFFHKRYKKTALSTLWLGLSYYAWKMRALNGQWISAKMKDWPHWQLRKSKFWGPFLSYQLNSTANPAHLPHNWAKLAKLALLFSLQLQKGSQDFDFFNCYGCRLFILCEFHCY